MIKELIKKFKIEVVEVKGKKELFLNSRINPTAFEICKIKSYKKLIIEELEKINKMEV